MKQKISEWMDGESHSPETERLLAGLRAEGEARQAWRTYHLIGDTLRDTQMLSPRFAERMAASLEKEPTVLAPAAVAAERSWRRHLMPAAAGLAAAGFVGAVAFMMPMQQPSAPSAPQIAQAPQVKPTPAAQVSEPAPQPVPLPAATDDYLLAHQGYSPRNRLQGVAPYVRTVSGQALEGRR